MTIQERLRRHAEGEARHGSIYLPPGLANQAADEIDRLRARVAELERGPAAIVEVQAEGSDGSWSSGDVHAFEDTAEAERFNDDEPAGEERLITYVRGWTWHRKEAGHG